MTRIIIVILLLVFCNTANAVFLEDTFVQFYFKQTFQGTYLGLCGASRLSEGALAMVGKEIPLSSQDDSLFFCGMQYMVDEVILEYQFKIYEFDGKLEPRTRLGFEF